MSRRRAAKFTYTAVRSEGGMLPYEVLERIAAESSELGIEPTGYNLAESERIGDAITRSWRRLTSVWRNFRGRHDLDAAAALVAETRRGWLRPLFQELGYGTLKAVNKLEVGEREFPISHEVPHVPIHLLGIGVDLDTRTPRVVGASSTAPHALVQDFLNRSEAHLWGVVCNGRKLRLLRDSHTFTRRPYLEFDLELMFETDSFADFRVLWLCAHHSRLSPPEGYTGRPNTAPIEHWYEHAKREGVRVRDRLRDGVAEAIEILGVGFRAHRLNTNLQAALSSGALNAQDYYRQLLRLVYRLIFVFVAEDRNLLLPPLDRDNPDEQARIARDRYLNDYATTKLRELAHVRKGDAHEDRWIGLCQVLDRLYSGCKPLHLPALGSDLFSSDSTPALHGAHLANNALLPAIRELCTFKDAAGYRRQVSWRNIGADELGSVFESLLELVPEFSGEKGFRLVSAAGNERKTTGSYYTPEPLVECLLDSALDPVLDRACSTRTPEQSILDLKVCDPSCGSGHFLAAAGRRIAHRLALVRAGGEEPSPQAIHEAQRDVYARCLYGVDINPMAVELCKVSLWLEANDPKRPLPFLESHIRCGNALLGATPALLANGIPDAAFNRLEGDDAQLAKSLKAQSKRERQGKATERKLFTTQQDGGTTRYNAVRENLATVEQLPDDTLASVEAKTRSYRQSRESPEAKALKLLADTWCAAFVWPKQTAEDAEYAPTYWWFRKAQADIRNLRGQTVARVEKIAERFNFFHWHLEFPQVFGVGEVSLPVKPGETGCSGGFDVVLGNPPWERLKLQEKEFFATRDPAIADAPKAATRKKMIARLPEENPSLWEEWQEALRCANGESQAIRNCTRFPLCGHGDINTYAVFAELNRHIVASYGRVGCIVPSGISTDSRNQYYFQSIFEDGSLVSLFSFFEIREFFTGADSRDSFTLLTLLGRDHSGGRAQLAFDLREVSEIQNADKLFVLSPSDIVRMNPNTRTCPIFRTRADAEIVKAIYQKVPILINDTTGENPWGVEFKRMLDMAIDSSHFTSKKELRSQHRIGNYYTDGEKVMLPLYEAKMLHHFNHRFGTYEGQTKAQANQKILPRSSYEELSSPRYFPQSRHWVEPQEVDKRLDPSVWAKNWVLGWRDVCRTSDVRTVIASAIPRYGVGHTSPVMLPKAGAGAFLLGNLCSFVLDYAARQKVGGTHLTYGILKQLPILPPNVYEGSPGWCHDSLSTWILPRVLELTYTAWDLAGFARDHGYEGPPFRWDTDRRFWLRAELDAAFFHLYGLDAEEVEHVMESFVLVRKRDVKSHGSYRTKDAILSIYNEMARAAASGTSYQTRLDPPPADPSQAHPELTPEERELLAPVLERALKKIEVVAPKAEDGEGKKVRRKRTAAKGKSKSAKQAEESPLFSWGQANESRGSEGRESKKPDADKVGLTREMSAVLRVLGEQGGLGKAGLLEAAKLEAKAWSRTIGALVEAGLVVKVGRGRGTRYELGGG